MSSTESDDEDYERNIEEHTKMLDEEEAVFQDRLITIKKKSNEYDRKIKEVFDEVEEKYEPASMRFGYMTLHSQDVDLNQATLFCDEMPLQYLGVNASGTTIAVDGPFKDRVAISPISKKSNEEKETPAKRFISPNELQSMSFNLAKTIFDCGFRPTFIIALWRGGTPIAMYVQELLAYLGNETDHIAIRTSSYVGTKQQTEIKVHGLHYIVENANAKDRVLIVDDIFDSGRSAEAVINQLKKQMRKNFPQEVRIATLFVKTGKNKTDIIPDYYIEETDQWIVFPHELEGLSLKTIMAQKGFNPFAPLETKKNVNEEKK